MNACLYCGERLSRKMNFHACCYQLCHSYIQRQHSSYWNLLEVLADRASFGIADTFPVLDEWERLGLVIRDSVTPKYRMLSERGKRLYEYIRVRRERKFAGVA